MMGAALSKDPVMVEAYTVPKKLKDADGNEYKNPYSDLHCMSAVTCIMPSWFKGIPETEWVDHSKKVPPQSKRSPRDNGKVLNFAEIYLSSAQSIAERNHISLEIAKEWDKRHKETYKGYYDWAKEIGRVAAARGYAINARGRHRWVN